MTAKLKEDEMNQYFALSLIKKNTTDTSEEEIIKVFLVVCDPLVENQLEKEKQVTKEVIYPLYHNEIDVPNHLERLKNASQTLSNMSIVASRVWGSRDELTKCLKCSSSDIKNNLFSVVQIFTRVERHKGVIVISL